MTFIHRHPIVESPAACRVDCGSICTMRMPCKTKRLTDCISSQPGSLQRSPCIWYTINHILVSYVPRATLNCSSSVVQAFAWNEPDTYVCVCFFVCFCCFFLCLCFAFTDVTKVPIPLCSQSNGTTNGQMHGRRDSSLQCVPQVRDRFPHKACQIDPAQNSFTLYGYVGSGATVTIRGTFDPVGDGAAIACRSNLTLGRLCRCAAVPPA